MQELKGAAWATIAAFARRAEFAPALWERLLQVRILLTPGLDACETVMLPVKPDNLGELSRAERLAS